MKKIVSCLFTLLFCLCIFTTVFADTNLNVADTNLNVVDNANLLSEEEEQKLKGKIEEIVDKYDFDIVIYTTDSCEGKSVRAFADDTYDFNGYGIGENKDGILFLLSMEQRDYYISTRGYGINAFTDYGIEYIGDHISSNLSDANYYKAIDTFLSDTDKFLRKAKKGTPYDVKNTVKGTKEFMIVLAISGIVALVTVLIMKSKMKTSTPQKYAQEYANKDSFNITNRQDVFLHSNITKTKRVQASSSSNSSGGSSTHTSSSGASHGGGGGKF